MKIHSKSTFFIIWLFSTILLLINLFNGLSKNWIIIIGSLYVISLLFYIIQPLKFNKFEGDRTQIFNIKYLQLWELIISIISITILIFVLGLYTSISLILALFSLIISLFIIYILRTEITKHIIIMGLFISLLCTIYSYSVSNHFLSILVLPIVASIFIAGSILNNRFSISTVQTNQLNYPKAIKSFFIGSLLAIPMALSNLSDALITNPDKWATKIWHPLLAFPGGILEETWFRLFLISFLFALLIPKSGKPIIPIITGILISSFIHGFGHYPQVDINNCINISLLYSTPMAVLFVWRDLETAIGYHFLINFLRTIGGYMLNNELL